MDTAIWVAIVTAGGALVTALLSLAGTYTSVKRGQAVEERLERLRFDLNREGLLAARRDDDREALLKGIGEFTTALQRLKDAITVASEPPLDAIDGRLKGVAEAGREVIESFQTDGVLHPTGVRVTMHGAKNLALQARTIAERGQASPLRRQLLESLVEDLVEVRSSLSRAQAELQSIRDFHLR